MIIFALQVTFKIQEMTEKNAHCLARSQGWSLGSPCLFVNGNGLWHTPIAYYIVSTPQMFAESDACTWFLSDSPLWTQVGHIPFHFQWLLHPKLALALGSLPLHLLAPVPGLIQQVLDLVFHVSVTSDLCQHHSPVLWNAD